MEVKVQIYEIISLFNGCIIPPWLSRVVQIVVIQQPEVSKTPHQIRCEQIYLYQLLS